MWESLYDFKNPLQVLDFIQLWCKNENTSLVGRFSILIMKHKTVGVMT